MLELDLRPGLGLGAFELGTSLWNVLDFLRENKAHFPHIDVKFDTEQPATSPIILHIRPHIDLLFSGKSQRLHTISLRRLRIGPPNTLTLKYRDLPLLSPNTMLNRQAVNKVFGPTYAGDALRYPGVWFGFDEDGEGGGALGVGKKGEGERGLEVKRVVVTQRTDIGKEIDPLGQVLECPAMYGEVRKAVIKVHEGVSLYFHAPSMTSSAPARIRIGRTTAQDLVCDLGAPLRVHYKEDERMAIHSDGADDVDEGYFYNYFQHGIDVLISGVTHKVQKVILHSNVVGSHFFQRYKRCPWEFDTGDGEDDFEDEDQPSLAYDTKIENLTPHLSPSTSTPPPSMVLDRSADLQETLNLPSGTTRLLGFDGVVLEVTEIGDVLAVMLF